MTFSDPEVEKSPEGEEANCSTEPSIMDAETWLEWLAWQLGTPAWWVELGAIPGIKDLQNVCPENKGILLHSQSLDEGFP